MSPEHSEHSDYRRLPSTLEESPKILELHQELLFGCITLFTPLSNLSSVSAHIFFFFFCFFPLNDFPVGQVCFWIRVVGPLVTVMFADVHSIVK